MRLGHQPSFPTFVNVIVPPRVTGESSKGCAPSGSDASAPVPAVPRAPPVPFVSLALPLPLTPPSFAELFPPPPTVAAPPPEPLPPVFGAVDVCALASPPAPVVPEEPAGSEQPITLNAVTTTTWAGQSFMALLRGKTRCPSLPPHTLAPGSDPRRSDRPRTTRRRPR